MVLKVNTTNFQDTAGESFRTPVETFVEPVTTQPKTALMELAATLSNINPTLQKFVDFKIQEGKQEGILAGQNLLLGADPEEIKRIKKELEAKEGKPFARNFIGGNIYTQYGIEKQLAINLGNASEARTANFFEDYTVNGIPLSQFDIDSEEFQQAIRDFEATSLVNTRGIRPQILNEYFFPKQSLALAQFYSEHQNDLAEAKIEQAGLLLEPAILNSWFSIDTINKQIELNIIDNDGFIDGYNYSLNELQRTIDNYVEGGLSSLVSPAKMLEYMETNMFKILEYYEDNNLDMNLAYEEIEEYVEWISGLEVGPAKQPLSDFFEVDGEDKVDTMLKEIFERKEEFIKKQLEYESAVAQKEIINTFNEIDFSNVDMTLDDYKQIGQTLEDLAIKFPNEIEFIYQQYDLKNFNVDNFFFDLEERFDGGSLSQSEALKELSEFMLALGPAASNADRKNYTDLKDYINKTEGKSFIQRFPEVKDLEELASKKLGKTNALGFGLTTQSDYIDQEIDLNQELRKRVKEAGGVTEEIKDWYREELRKIINDGYEFYDDFNDFSIDDPVREEEGEGNGDEEESIEDTNEEEFISTNQPVKALIYNTETKLFEEVDIQNIPENATIVSINGVVTPTGTSLQETLDIKTFDNFNFERYNQNIKNEETKIENENLRENLINQNNIEDDTRIVSDIDTTLGAKDGDLIAMANTTNEIQSLPLLDTYTVVSGDTISSIADKYEGVTMQNIINYNNFDTEEKQNNIQIGQKIKIPEIEIQESSGQITPTIETKTELWNQFNGAAEYGSGDRKTDLETRDDYLTTLDGGHAYANVSNEVIQQELKKIYSDLFYSNDKESIEIKNAIVNMVLTEADLSDLNDIAGVVQSVFARIARARLNDSRREGFSTDIIEELMRQEFNKEGKLVPMYEGLVGSTREEITSNKPIKENQETFDRIFDILWKEPTTNK